MVRPMGPRALVKRLEEPKPESSVIVVPDTVGGPPSQYAIVIAVGTLEQGGFDAGDVVILDNYAGAPCNVEIDGEVVEAVMVSEKNVLAVVDE